MKREFTGGLVTLWVSAVTMPLVSWHTAVAQPEHGGDACALLTDNEVASILGVAAQGMDDPFSGFDAACTWASLDNGTTQELSIQVGQLDVSFIVNEFNAFRENMTIEEQVAGIGDDAFIAQYGLEGASLALRAGTFIVFINTTRADQEETLKALAPEVLARLQ